MVRSFVPFTHNVLVRLYTPGAITIVLLGAAEFTAAWSCSSVDTFTTVPTGAGKTGALLTDAAQTGRTINIATAQTQTSAYAVFCRIGNADSIRDRGQPR